MTDVNPDPNPLFLREEEIRQAMELLFFAYREFTAEADAALARFSFGRAHHRALYFIGRNPQITVGALLAILKITKQSLSRVLNELKAQDLVSQRTGPNDRRERRLSLTPAGAALEQEIMQIQRKRLSAAFRESGAGSVDGFRRVLYSMVDPQDRGRIGGLKINPPSGPRR